MSFKGGVIQETRKGKKPSDSRFIVLYGGKVHRSSRKSLALMARDRAFDLSHQKFLQSKPEEQKTLLAKSIDFQKRAKKRGVMMLTTKLTAAKGKHRQRLQKQLATLKRVRPRSPHLGHKPISAYLGGKSK